jgi:4-alpha-glucanotransferase
MLPERSRETGHRYFAECLRHAMSVAGMLRIDHVMSLHRVFWIPRGADPRDGIYVRHPADELYAVLCIESQRARCKVVGEDLGTVPRELRPALRRHAVLRTSVLQNAEGRTPNRPLTSTALPGVASLQTHDMPPLADWWRGGDIDRRLKLGLLNEAAARRERRAREKLRAAWLRDLGESDSRGLLPALLSLMSAGESRCVLVDLEDLWGESRPQNIPGTTDAWPNWRRRARLPFETFRERRRLLSALRKLAARDRKPAR